MDLRPPLKHPESGNAQAGVGGGGGVACGDGDASVSSSAASLEQCVECEALFGPGSGGGFSPADESLLCGVCVEARGFDRLAEWETQYAWDD